MLLYFVYILKWTSLTFYDIFFVFCRYQNHQDHDQNSSHGKINVPLVSECSEVVKYSNRDRLHSFLQTLISSEVYYEPIKSENRGHWSDLVQNCFACIRVWSVIAILGAKTITIRVRWCAALVFLNFTARPHYSLIFHRYLFYPFFHHLILIHIFFSFWRGTNPFATVKLRPTTTNDRSAPRFNQQWHLNPETNAFVNHSTSPLTVKMVVFWKLERRQF